jgi:hypothetical protein
MKGSMKEKLDDTQSIYTPDAGTTTGPYHCGVCGTLMDEVKSCNGPRGWAQAMAGGKSAYDEYSCPVRDEMWHKQVIALRNEAHDCSSARLEAMLREEAAEVLKARKPSKESGGWRYGMK